ncbi:MAG TPA: isoleucine--tRNA ligase [Candidatus Solibacter sp.]|jgi:isoleucyl-tRNA synthetase|nr:isoleucine--tRNA ligase [Candidatus Solibacter sp.]
MTESRTSGAFAPVDSKVSFPEMEKRVREFWEREGIFRRSIEERPADKTWVFYEGPPTANGLPHMGHVIQRTLKDLFPRFHTMRGSRVVRKAGWDTHGLPVEIEVEKELGFTNKKQVEDYGIDAFNKKCRESVFRYIDIWTAFTHQLGFWLDLDDPYVTYESAYTESVWAILKKTWDRGLLYKGYRVVPYCPRCATPLSSHELSLGYQDDVKDPSVYPLFELTDEPGTYFLAWTTTPWTLPGNVALAVGPDIQYVKVQNGDRKLILAEARLEVLEAEYQVLEKLRSTDLVGKTYRSLYDYLVPKEPAFFVVEANFVSVEDGTGIVHTAAAYGEDDLKLAQEKGIPVRHVVDLNGRFLPEVEKFAGQFVKDADVPIMVDLSERGLLYKKGTIRHTYPFCWRCGTPLLYYAMDSWFIRMSEVREKMIEVNRGTNWYPSHIREGRMGNWLESLQDWSLSRLRYWGTPLPIWECESCDERRCVGSVAELGLSLEDDLHRPYIDRVTLPCPQCGATMHRVPDLIDVWFDSGAMPFAQYHQPFENDDVFAHQYPADFICEGLDQTRGWFYSLMAIGVLMAEQNSYRNVVVNGTVLDKDGKKMSKSVGNVVDPIPVIERYGADAVRWYFVTAASIGNDYRFGEDLIQKVATGVLSTLWHSYSFFVTYANLDGFQPGQASLPVSERALIDRWLVSQLNICVRKVTEELEEFDPTGSARAIESFIDDLSNWYIRRSRRRFWKSESDADKASAYQTLHQALVTTAQLLAPFTPFIADELFRNLATGGADSVHLSDWPEVDAGAVDEKLSADMARARRIVEMGHKERDRANLKVRQPLAGATVPGPPLGDELEAIVLDELNLKSLSYGDPGGREVILDAELTPELRREGLAREVVRRVQGARKDADYNIEDRIEVLYHAGGELAEAVAEWTERIAGETLAVALDWYDGGSVDGYHHATFRIGGDEFEIALRRV